MNGIILLVIILLLVMFLTLLITRQWGGLLLFLLALTGRSHRLSGLLSHKNSAFPGFCKTN